MPKKRYTPEEIVAKLRQVDVLTSQGRSLGEAIRAIGVVEDTYYRWRKEFAEVKVFKNYPKADFERISDIVQRAAGDCVVDRALLEEDLLSAIYATGTAQDGSEPHRYWSEALAGAPGSRELADGFRRMAEAPNPLDPAICTEPFRARLSGVIHSRWSTRWRREGRGDAASLRLITWDALSDSEQTEIREICQQLERFHRGHLPRNRPHKNDLTTLMHLLAGIFALHTGFREQDDRLPHSPSSRFIQFASMALAGFFEKFEVSTFALARRWRREKARAGLLEPDVSPGD